MQHLSIHSFHNCVFKRWLKHKRAIRNARFFQIHSRALARARFERKINDWEAFTIQQSSCCSILSNIPHTSSVNKSIFARILHACINFIHHLRSSMYLTLWDCLYTSASAASLVVISCFFFAPNTNANIITQWDADYGLTTADLDVRFSNNDNGAQYDSYNTVIFSNLSDSLWALSHNQSTYSSQADMEADWTAYAIRDPPTGEVSDGWQTDGNWSNLEFSNLGGIPGLDYDVWHAEQQDAGQNDLFFSLGIPKSQLDGDGDGWNASDPNDYLINLGPSQANMGVGHAGFGNDFSANGAPYNIQQIPEPSTVSLLALACLGLYARSKRV